MAARIKNLFHHKKDDEDTPDSPTQDKGSRRRFSRSDKHKPASMDESDMVGSGAAGMHGRQSGTYSRGGPPQIGDLGYTSNSGGLQDGPLSSEFSRLNLDGTPGHQADSVHPSQTAPGQGQSYRGSPSHSAAGIRHVNPEDTLPQSSGHHFGVNEHRNNYPASSTANTYDSTHGQYPHEQGIRPTTIPRKEVGSSTTPPGTSSSHVRQSSLQKPLPTAPHEARDLGIRDPSGVRDPTTPSGPTHAKAGLQGIGGELTAEEVVERARRNTTDTTVTEKIAPAVVHETVNKEVHHIRQEVVTREIHTHDYYHRTLPVIDVEVLPPRHFLPVEGGGLVEVGADEVPGRGRNWVIAETASKVASSDTTPVKPNVFSAREFVGQEGDEKRYITDEGYERTEQTWVHPPELETGARETGQTWPMEFGKRAEGHSPGQGQSSQGRSWSHSQGQTRSPTKEGRKKKGILKNPMQQQPVVDDRIDAPGTAH